MIRKIGRFIPLLFNVVFALFLLTTLLVGYISPEKVSFISSFSLFFPYLLMINVCCVVLWLVLWRKYVFISLIALLISSPAIIKSYPIFKGNVEKTGNETELKILSYNTMSSFEYKKHKPNSPNKGIQYILDSDADIVCLQEFGVNKNNEYLTHQDVLKIFEKYKYKHIRYRDEKNIRQIGMATFSKYPILNKQFIDYPSRYNSSIFTDIDVNGTTIRVVNVHLESNKVTGMDKVMAKRLKENFDRENISEVTQFFSKKLNEAAKIRAKQVDIVADTIKQSPHKVIVCGDFNDVSLSYAYKKMRGDMLDAFAQSGRGVGLTYSNGLYQLRIDYILHDNEFKSTDFKVDKVKYSDHYPIMCSLWINPTKE